MGATPQGPDALHDQVIQRLFTAGLYLKRAVAALGNDPDGARACIEQAIDDLDDTVETVRGDGAGAPIASQRASRRCADWPVSGTEAFDYGSGSS